MPPDLRVSVLTPPGTGAIATVSVAGVGAWEAVRARFRPAKGALPEVPPLHRFWFGTLGDGAGDEVIAAVRQVEPEVVVEIHCHGGRRVVRWVVETLAPLAPPGEVVIPPPGSLTPSPSPQGARGVDNRALGPLTRAITTRTAAVALDQYHGAFHRAVEQVLADLPNDLPRLYRLAKLAPVGRHLAEPWRVVVAGPPNVGKSSLVNALAGYERSVVAPVAGTTRDVVTVRLAFDGWPVELSDTAGLRESAEELETAGIARARQQLAAAELVVWVLDLTDPEPVRPHVPADLLVGNKVDRLAAAQTATPFDLPLTGAGGKPTLAVSAATGDGLPALIAAVVRKLVPVPPDAGEAVPFTPALADLITQAAAAARTGDTDTTRQLLRSCLAAS